MHREMDRHREVAGLDLAYDLVGSGPPLLLLHGWPESRHMWRAVADRLDDRFTMIIPDLPGYGESQGPQDPAAYDKRTVATTMLALVDELGLEGPLLAAGHDRGGRVLRRAALDHPDRFLGVSLLDIMPMEWAFDQGAGGYAARYGHWYFFLQGYADGLLAGRGALIASHVLERSHAPLPEADVARYVTFADRTSWVLATLADYRTAFHLDAPRYRTERAAGVRITIPTQVLWGEAGNLGDAPVLDAWREVATDVQGEAVPDAGHYLAEEQPDAVARLLTTFAASCPSR